MKMLKKYIILTLALAGTVLSSMAEDVDFKYRRNSLYSILVSHNEQQYYDEIRQVFEEIPIPEKYNDHDLSVKVLNVDKKDKYEDAINDFVNNSNVASRMVAKWFNRDKFTGVCDLDLITERGLYDASTLDRELASRSTRGQNMLTDAGELLIGNTFLLVNEVNYIDKQARSKNVAAGLKIGGALLGTFVPGANDLFKNIADMVETIKGFSVKIHTRLYQLQWDDEAAGIFYKECWTSTPDPDKVEAFEQNRDKFKLIYIGDIESKGGTTSFMGIREDKPLIMIRKACQRAIDDNIADLQKKYEQFRVKSPVLEVDNDGFIKVEIGMKEAIDKDSKYEVLEPQEKDGRIEYKRVAIIQPMPGRIWDNRYMATEEGAYGANFGATLFKKTSGGDIYPGLLVREID